MPEARRERWGRRRPLVTAETFVEYLMHEIERYDRYQRRFSLLLAKAPAEGNEKDRVMSLRRAAAAVDRSIRACDLAALFQRHGLIATLLPEVGLDGARVVHERFISIIGGPETGWTFKMAAYPENAEIIEQFADRADQLVESEPAAASLLPTQDPSPPRASRNSPLRA